MADKEFLDYEGLTEFKNALNGVDIVTTAGDGANYTATVPGITALKAGLTITLIPHTVSTAVQPKLNVNGLGAKAIRRRLTNSTVSTVASASANWLAANKPIRVTYDGTYWIADMDRPNAPDIYGTVAIANGGTGASTAEAALAALGAVAKTELRTLAYNATDANGDVTQQTISAYPTTFGVHRVGDPTGISGLPVGVLGYGTLVIFDAGGYRMHLYLDGSGLLHYARTDDTLVPKGWTGTGGGEAWSNASPASNFGAQKISTNISGWSYVAIKFAFHTSLCADDLYTWWEVCPVGFGGAANFTSLGGDGHPVSVRRKYTVDTSGVTFGVGGYHQGTTNNLSDNSRAIPMEIRVF